MRFSNAARAPRGAKFDAELARATIEKVAPRIYDDPKLTPQAKFKAVDRHCTLLCDQKRFDDALEIAKRYTEMKDAKGKGWARSCVALKNVYRLMDRYPDALTALKRGIAAAPQKGDLCAEAAKLALEFGDVKSVPAIWALDTDSNAEYKTMSWVLENKDALDEVAAFRDATLKGVLPFLSNVKNPANQRLWLACRAGLVADTPEGAAARKAVGDVLASGKASLDWGVVHKLRWMFMDGNWKGFASVYNDLKSVKALQKPELRRAHLFALAAAGRGDEAKRLVADYRAEMDKPEDLVRTDALMAVIEDRDALAVITSAKLAPKDHALAVQLVAEWALVLQKNDACRRYADAYAKLIVPIPQRRQNVTWSAKPLDGEAEWRALWPSLEKSYIDVKMCGDLDNLVTDVATGRVAVEKTDKDTKDARVEVTSACDVKGLRLYLRVADPNARAVEDGFAGGKGTEMYFAPGDNQPYICFGGRAARVSLRHHLHVGRPPAARQGRSDEALQHEGRDVLHGRRLHDALLLPVGRVLPEAADGGHGVEVRLSDGRLQLGRFAGRARVDELGASRLQPEERGADGHPPSHSPEEREVLEPWREASLRDRGDVRPLG